MLCNSSKAFTWALLLAVAEAAAPTVTLSQGIYIGTTTKIAAATPIVNKFLGIPFSDKIERFDPPRPPPDSKARFQATSQAPACIQQFNFPTNEYNFVQSLYNNPPVPESEDCLYLNVFTPADADGTLPVLFWIYPGAFQFGSGTRDEFDGTNFAAKHKVIYVAINSRTNVFGFPGGPPEVPTSAQNVGILDIWESLFWVQKNIAKFGGDPKKVTIFGESSGAVAADYLTISFAKNPPFRGAIFESGTAIISPASGYSWSALQPTLAGPPWPALAKALGCTGDADSIYQCVKRAPASTVKNILQTQRLSFAQVVVDNKTVFSDGYQRRQRGQVARVPIMTGSNKNEFNLFLAIGLIGYIPTIDIPGAVETVVGGVTGIVGGLLGPFNPFPKPKPSSTSSGLFPYPTANLAAIPYLKGLSDLATDISFNCPSALTANASAYAGIPTWRYVYNGYYPNTQPWKNGLAFHTSEIPLVFGNFAPGIAIPSIPPTPAEQSLTEFMQAAWANFAKNPQAGPGWDAYEASSYQTYGELGGRNPYGVANVDVSENDQRCGLLGPVAVFQSNLVPREFPKLPAIKAPFGL